MTCLTSSLIQLLIWFRTAALYLLLKREAKGFISCPAAQLSAVQVQQKLIFLFVFNDSLQQPETWWKTASEDVKRRKEQRCCQTESGHASVPGAPERTRSSFPSSPRRTRRDWRGRMGSVNGTEEIYPRHKSYLWQWPPGTQRASFEWSKVHVLKCMLQLPLLFPKCYWKCNKAKPCSPTRKIYMIFRHCSKTF